VWFTTSFADGLVMKIIYLNILCPNPTSDFLNIKMADNRMLLLAFFNFLGQKNRQGKYLKMQLM
jgi:hypothetical protein